MRIPMMKITMFYLNRQPTFIQLFKSTLYNKGDCRAIYPFLTTLVPRSDLLIRHIQDCQAYPNHGRVRGYNHSSAERK